MSPFTFRFLTKKIGKLRSNLFIIQYISLLVMKHQVMLRKFKVM